jgi:hypothetical protein
MLENSRYTCIHIKISPCLGLLTMDQTWLVHLFFSLTLNTKKDIIENYQKRSKICRNLIVWQLSPYVRTNRNHKQTYEFLIQAALI